jgi:hypothetical protein
LVVAKKRMKEQAYQHCNKRNLEVEDWVFLRLQPYKQMSLKQQKENKLAPKYYGPYKVLEGIGNITYKLELSPSRVHPTFCVF